MILKILSKISYDVPKFTKNFGIMTDVVARKFIEKKYSKSCYSELCNVFEFWHVLTRLLYYAKIGVWDTLW